MKYIDNFLNKITMYRLVLYYLISMIVLAMILGFTGSLAINPWTLLFSTITLVFVAWLANLIFVSTFETVANTESVYISALILALIVAPPKNTLEFMGIFWVAVLMVASKFILTYKGKHIFNPVALAVCLTAFTINFSANWWIDNSAMLPFVVIGGALIVRKIRRFDMVLAYLVSSLVTIGIIGLIKHGGIIAPLKETLLYSPLIFFASIMLTEPQTTPPTTKLQIIYGALIGFLFAPQLHFGSIYSTPELALLGGNIYSFAVSPKSKLILTLKEKVQYGRDTLDMIFSSNQKIAFTPGQYLEWTLPVPNADDRGNRRYFTIASSPTEQDLHIGVKFYPEPSRFKANLANLKVGNKIVASQLSGSFVLSKDPAQKSVFIAGGIGVTPFRSMLKYLLDTDQKRDIVMFYSNKLVSEIIYRNVFDQARDKLRIKTVFTLTDTANVPPNWNGKVGIITAEMLAQEVPDYKDRIFYLSGPRAMVVAYEKLLKSLNIPRSQIKIDYFPGFA